MKLPIFIVDAFSGQPFGGNPAAVCLLKNDLSDHLKQKIAAEMNLSETAFVLASEGSSDDVFKTGGQFFLRWFTPETEVPICGHATLASAMTLFSEAGNINQTIEFVTREKGILTVTKSTAGDLEMRLPVDPPSVTVTKDDVSLWKLVEATLEGKTDLVQEVRLCPTAFHCLVIRLRDEVGREGLESIDVPEASIVNIDTGDSKVKGVILTVKGGSTAGDFDFFSRYLGHWVGIPEDPVTGSSFAVLGPFWANRLGKRSMRARQCSKRGGVVGVNVDKDFVRLRGEATVVLRGSIHI